MSDNQRTDIPNNPKPEPATADNYLSNLRKGFRSGRGFDRTRWGAQPQPARDQDNFEEGNDAQKNR